MGTSRDGVGANCTFHLLLPLRGGMYAQSSARTDFDELGAPIEKRTTINVKYGPADGHICEVLPNTDETLDTLTVRMNEIVDLEQKLKELKNGKKRKLDEVASTTSS